MAIHWLTSAAAGGGLVGSSASELKHGRVAMLAVLGWFVESVFHLPGDIYSVRPTTHSTTIDRYRLRSALLLGPWWCCCLWLVAGWLLQAANPLEAVTRVPLLSHIQIFACTHGRPCNRRGGVGGLC